MALILVIDDEQSMRDWVCRALERAGHDTIEAGDGAVGLNLMRQCRPDLVLTDIFMPAREGIETILEIRRSDPEMPIVAMSGGGLYTASFLDAARKLGADATLRKPFRASELVATIGEVLARPEHSEPHTAH